MTQSATPTRPHPLWVRVVRKVGRAMAVMGSIVSAGIMLGIVADVVRRQVTGRSIPGMIELIETFMVVVVFLGLAHAEEAKVHVRMSLVTGVLPFVIRRVVKVFGMFACMLGSAWFAWATWERALLSVTTGEVKPGLLRFPVWPARLVIAVGFAVLAVEYVARIWEEWHAKPTPPALVAATAVDIPPEEEAVTESGEAE